jgi:hypothetical protein
MPVPCPVCDGSMPKSRTPNMRHVMCRHCWRAVPPALRKEHRQFNTMARATGWPGKPAPAGLQPAWSQCSARCVQAAMIARHGGA